MLNVVDRSPSWTAFGCMTNGLTIQCAPGRRLKIISAVYGRTRPDICVWKEADKRWRGYCSSMYSTDIVTTRRVDMSVGST